MYAEKYFQDVLLQMTKLLPLGTYAAQARKKIAQAKVGAPNVVLRVIDEAAQAHGAAGVSQDTTLARLWAAVRTLRLADGPDAVHIASIAKLELAESRQREPISRL